MPRPRVYDDALRGRLIDRAAGMLAQGGPSALVLRSLAAAEGTSTSAVYALFGDKDALIAEVLVAARASFGAAQRDVGASADLIGDLVGLGRAYRNWALANPALYHVMFGGPLAGCEPTVPHGGEIDETLLPLHSAVQRLVSGRRAIGAKESGVRRAALVDTIAMSLWASVHGMVALEIAELVPGSDRQREELFTAHLRAIARSWAPSV